MVRKHIAERALISLVAIIALYLIVNLLTSEKTWGRYVLGAVGFASLPVLAHLYVRTLNILPVSKVVIISAIWAAWVVLAAITAFATYYYWYNYGGPSGATICSGGLCAGTNTNLQ